jgi:hypothetical protein
MIELMNSLLMSFPGTPIIYYGDEIGMGDNIYLGDRNGVRTPMLSGLRQILRRSASPRPAITAVKTASEPNSARLPMLIVRSFTLECCEAKIVCLHRERRAK